MTLFFTSDEHFHHRNILTYSGRPFADVTAMNEALVANHNRVVGPDDEVWHLGDFSLDDRKVQPFLSRLNGTHTLFVGNHDRCHPCHKGSGKAARFYLDCGFREVLLEKFVDFGGALGKVHINHMPTRGGGDHATRHAPGGGGEYAERYSEWRPTPEHQAECRWMLHGHVHEAWKVRGKMINLGVDVWDYTPVSLPELQAFVEGLHVNP